jgi:hypothetical protein
VVFSEKESRAMRWSLAGVHLPHGRWPRSCDDDPALGRPIDRAVGGDAMERHLTLTDRARAVLILTVVSLAAAVLAMAGPPIAAQDTFPTPVGRLGGREPLSTAEAAAIAQPPQGTPTPVPADSASPLAGTWLLDFGDEDRPPARLILGEDGTATFADADGNRGAGAWVASGAGRALLVVAIRETGPAGRERRLALLQGAMEVGAMADVATLDYTTSTMDDSGRAGEQGGPFAATALRASDG